MSILRRKKEKIMKKKSKKIEKEWKKDLKFFRKVAKSGVQINATQAVREERDRDDV